ncbi:hypothetical protein, partial [Halorubrum sp. SP9]|uniref:hypothetical protein n=2 Tax=Halorubrum TaxID=56688 RepID=UPI0013052639
NIVGVVSSRAAASPNSDADEQEADEPEAFATFSKDEVERLYEAVSKAGDKQAKRILLQAYVDVGCSR